jgi:serine phosphatase RsbU (regulator of sigma subunit)
MANVRLEVNDGLGRRVIAIDKAQITIGRRTENDLRLVGSDVSRDHAEIVEEGDGYVLKDRGSRYGTFVNDEQITERTLAHGDRIQFGRTSGTDVVFLVGEASHQTDRPPQTAVSDLRQLAALLEGLRAMGSGRVLDEVLALVLDAAIEVTGAERGFIMLANPQNVLEMKLARARGRITMPGNRFDTSRKIPEEVYSQGELKIVADLLDGDLANKHMGTVALGIRHVACVPLKLIRFLEKADLPSETKSIGVLYLDSREKGSLLAPHTRAALDTLATEAGVAIENARLYRETLEKARIEHELKIAAEIQRSLLPEGRHDGPFYQSSGTSLQARSIGGDFFDLLDLPGNTFGFIVGDVAGKGPAAALLTSKILGIFSAFAYGMNDDPATTIDQLNKVLARRAIGARYATAVYGRLSPTGQLTFCSAGHNPALAYGKSGLRRFEAGGIPVGLFDSAPYESTTVQLDPGDTLVLYSDGVTEAHNVDGDEFGEQRLTDVLIENHARSAGEVLEKLVTAVKTFALGAEQYDDVTAVVIRYSGT